MFESYKLRRELTLYEMQQVKKARQMLESLPEFARDEDENQWKALSTGKKVYSETDVEEMQEQANSIYYKNPLARGIIETLVNFVVGKECKIIALDEDPKVQAYWDKFCRVNDFDKKSKEIVRRTLRDGEPFIRFFEPGETADVQKIRFVEPSEIKDSTNTHSYGIETDPGDVEKVLNYHRTFEKDKVQTPEVIPADDIIHEKINVDSNVKRGVSFFVGIASYITKYKGWLDDRIVLNKIRTAHNLIVKVTGISPKTYAAKFDDTTGKTTSGGTPKKKMPKSGSVLIANQGVDYEFKGLNIHASDTKDDGRAILLMIVVGTNLAEYMVTGDASNANYSSTMVAESPAVKAFEAWQDTFGKVFQKIYRKVISYGIEHGALPENSKKTITTFDKEKGVEVTEEEEVETSRDCQVDFPILIHRDVKDEHESLQIARLNGWVSDRTASGKLGYDYDEEQDQLAREEAQQKNVEKEKAAERMNAEEE